MEIRKGRIYVFIAGLVPAVVTFAVFWPSLKNGFVTWDDGAYVYKNAAIRSLDLNFVIDAFTTVMVSNYHPLTMLSYAVDYSLWGLDPFGYHLTNVVLHSLNTFLTGVVAYMLYKAHTKGVGGAGGAGGDGGTANGDGPAKTAFASFSALLFGLHPIHVESIAWVSERKDALSAFFFLLSVFFYLGFADREPGRRAAHYFASLVFFLLALLAKPMAISLPFVLLIMDFHPLKRTGIKSLLKEKLLFFALSAASAALTLLAQARAGSIAVADEFPLYARSSVAIRAYAFYIYKTFLPINLAPFYPLPYRADLFDASFWISALFILVATGLSAIALKRKRIFSAVWLYYVVTLFPVIGLVQVGPQAGADRYMYLPSLSVFMGVSALSIALLKKGRLATVMTSAVLVTTFVAMGILTVRQEAVWKDGIALWSHEISLYPDAPLAYNQRGLAYVEAHGYGPAMDDYNAVIKLDPMFSDAYRNRARVYELMGDYERALKDYDIADGIDGKKGRS